MAAEPCHCTCCARHRAREQELLARLQAAQPPVNPVTGKPLPPREPHPAWFAPLPPR